MVKTFEFSGTTIDSAISTALTFLKKERDDVTVEVIQTPKSGFLGLGAVPAKIMVSYDCPVEHGAVEFVKKITEFFGVSAEIEASVDEEEKIIRLNLVGDSMGVIIGRHGDTLDAIQYLTGIAINGAEEVRYRVIVDTENYRAKRESALINLARRTASKVLHSRRSFSLEPMSSYERRIIHSALQDFKGISTYSTGAEPNRRVVIALSNGNSYSSSYSKNYGGYSTRNQTSGGYTSNKNYNDVSHSSVNVSSSSSTEDQ